MVIWQPLPPVAIISFLTILTKVMHSSAIKHAFSSYYSIVCVCCSYSNAMICFQSSQQGKGEYGRDKILTQPQCPSHVEGNHSIIHPPRRTALPNTDAPLAPRQRQLL